MSLPTHHPPEDWLVAYVAGTLGEGESLILASHATLCPSCREHIHTLEEAAAARVMALEPVQVDNFDLAAFLDALPAQDDPAEHTPPPSPPALRDEPLPRAVREVLPAGDDVRWSFLAPGIHQIELTLRHEEMPARLLRLKPGLKVPLHTHLGYERTCVLQGGFSDQGGDYVLGDVSVRDGSEVHEQRIHAGEPCIALIVSDAPLVPVGVLSTVLSWFVKA